MKLRFIALLGIACALGCSSTGPFKGSVYESVRGTPAYPYSVKVTVNQALQGQVAQGALQPRIADEKMKAEIETAIVTALKEYNTFAYPYQGQIAGWEPDLELVVDVKARANAELGEVTRNNYIWANLFLWLAAGFPGWLIADQEIRPPVDISYTLMRPATKPLQMANAVNVDVSSDQRLNFISRAGIWQYVQQLIIPPFLVSSNKDIADGNLYENFLARIQRTVGETVKEGVRPKASAEGAGLPFLWLVSDSSSEKAWVFVFSRDAPQRVVIDERGADGKFQARPVDWSFNLNNKAFTDRQEIQRALQSDEILRTAFNMLKDGTYEEGRVLELERAKVNWSTEPQVHIKVTFPDDAKPWSWTPRIAATGASPALAKA